MVLFLVVCDILLFFWSVPVGLIGAILIVVILKSEHKGNQTENATHIANGQPDTEIPSIEFLTFNTNNFPDENIQIKSFSDERTIYTVNLKNQTCSCPDHFEYRSQYTHGDLRRFCKHMVSALFKKRFVEHIPYMVEPILMSARSRKAGTHIEKVYKAELNGKPVVITGNDNNTWHSVYKPRPNTDCARYGYNREEDRWAYSSKPRNHSEIKQIILANTWKMDLHP